MKDAKKNKLNSTVSTVIRIVSFAGRFRKQYFTGLVLAISDSIFSVGLVIGLQLIIDAMSRGDNRLLLVVLSYSFAGVMVCIILSMLGVALRRYSSIQTVKNMSHVLLDHINRLPFKFIQDNHSGDLAERVNADVSKAVEILSSSLVQLFSNLLTFLFAFVYLSTVNLELALFALSTGPITFAAGRFFDSRIRKAAEELNNKGGEQRGLMQEFLQSMPVVRVLGIDKLLIDKFRKMKASQLGVTKKKALLNLTMWRVVVFINAGATITLAYFVALAAINGAMSIGYVLSFIFLLSRLQWPFINISSTWGAINNSLGAADRVFKILDVEVENSFETTAKSVKPIDDTDYAVEISNLSFSYKGTVLFHDFNLKVKKGETIAIVGPSGSGKTTLARLCCGLFMPDEGDIKIFGYSIREDLKGAREKLAYVPQIPYLFTGTVEENILNGVRGEVEEADCVDVSDKDKRKDEVHAVVQEAAIMANSHTFISTLKEGYKSSLKEHGANLSGGQKQRIAIARALAGNAPLLIFDEATSSLDNESEQMIKATLDSLSGKHTMLVIAHRLSTVRNATRIIVLKNGCVAEEGTHDELLIAGGEYNRLYSEGQLTA